MDDEKNHQSALLDEFKADSNAPRNDWKRPDSVFVAFL